MPPFCFVKFRKKAKKRRSHTVFRLGSIARRAGKLDFAALKKLGVVLKRAQYFLTCSGKMIPGLRVTPESAMRALAEPEGLALMREPAEQLSFFSAAPALSHGKENSHESPLSLLA